MDLRLLHQINTFAFHHDGVEDPLSVYVKASELLFAAGLLLLFVLPGRGAAWRRPAAVACGVSAAIALLVGKLISVAVDRPRPFVADPSGVHLFARHAADAGFPSDHATAAFAIATALLLRRRAVGLAVLAAAALLAVGRVAVGVHYPSDVVAGAALGAGAALLVHRPRLRAVLDGGTARLLRFAPATSRRPSGQAL